VSHRNLRGANLYGANLRHRNLRGANLRGANLRRADLTNADLEGADLRDADLQAAKLAVVNLRGSNLLNANLRGANLRDADLTDAVLPEAPVVEDLDLRIAEAVGEHGEHLNMSDWHCGTSHCRAGWAIELAGAAGKALELRLGPLAAGALIYYASTGHVPEFYESDEDAFADIKARAEGAQ